MRPGSKTSLAVLRIVVAFILVAAAVIGTLTFLARRPLRNDGSAPITISWKHQVHTPESLAISNDGKICGTVDSDGLIQLFDGTGRITWQQQVPGATDVLIARHGQSLLAYSRLNPAYQKVFFYTATGRLLWRHTVDGSVWAGAVSADGDTAAVTTDQGFVYIYSPDPLYPRFRRWRIPGVGHTLAFTPAGDRIVVGELHDSAISSYDIDGRLLWRTKLHSPRTYEMTATANGQVIQTFVPGTKDVPSTELALWGSDGQPLWAKSLNGYDARALISPQGQRIAVSYAAQVSPKHPEMIERRIVVYEADGTPLWEKGGLFFGPRLVALSPDGTSVIVSDGSNTLYRIDSSGRILSKVSVGGKLRNIISAEDGSKVVFYCDDGWLYEMTAGKK